METNAFLISFISLFSSAFAGIRIHVTGIYRKLFAMLEFLFLMDKICRDLLWLLGFVSNNYKGRPPETTTWWNPQQYENVFMWAIFCRK